MVGPVPPPYGGIALYIQRILDSEIWSDFDFIAYNTMLPSKIRGYDVSTERGFTQIFKQRFVIIFGYVLYDFFRFFSILARNRPDIVHIHTCSFWGYYRSVIFLILSRCQHCRVAFHLHNAIDTFYYNDAGFFTRWIVRMSLKKADLNVALSPKLAELVRSITKYGDPVCYIETGIELERFDRADDKDDSGMEDICRILTIGQFTRNKGVFDIVASIPRVVERYQNVRFRFIGHGDQNRIRSFAEEKGILEYCEIAGPVDDVEKIRSLREAKVFLLPSYAEGHPAVILEAMAVGLPVISTDVGAIPEVVDDGINGFIIKPGDVEALANRIIQLISEPRIRHDMGEANYRKVRMKYSNSRVLDEIKDVYHFLSA